LENDGNFIQHGYPVRHVRLLLIQAPPIYGELLDNSELMNSQYDVFAGKWPKNITSLFDSG
jgi:hypothetical protein